MLMIAQKGIVIVCGSGISHILWKKGGGHSKSPGACRTERFQMHFERVLSIAEGRHWCAHCQNWCRNAHFSNPVTRTHEGY